MASHPTTIGEYVSAEALKLVRRHHHYESGQRDEARRMSRRRGVEVTAEIQRPQYWSVHPGFDPFYVLRRARGIAYAVERALDNDDYRPRPALRYSVPKTGGGTREVAVFQVADNAVSRLVYRGLRQKNASRLSPRCYAYRTDITLHDAVAYVASDLRDRSRIFVAEFDFKSFFDSISHEQIERTLRDRRFVISEREKRIIWSFVKAPVLDAANYQPQGIHPPREVGTPQGTSISLFLANAVAFPLDQRLERLGVNFVRYADDTVIWTNSYGEICRAADALSEIAADLGVRLNFKKSDGISVLVQPDERGELRQSKRAIEFVGYAVSKDSIGIRRAKVHAIKRETSEIIYRNLVQEIAAGHIVPARFAPHMDRDYLVMIQQLRRFLYGDVSEQRLRRYLARTTPGIRYKGLMSFYPLVDDEEQLKALDGWLLHTVFEALRNRTNRLLAAGHRVLPVPHFRPKEALLNTWGQTTQGRRVDLRVPSFARIGRLLRLASQEHGPNAVANVMSNQYY